MAEYTSWTASAAQYTHGPNIDDPISRVTSAGAQYYHQDGLGSVVALSNQTGTITGTQRFDAWGNKLASTGTIPQFGYTGREPDETGLIYYRARYYDPSIGRFTQRDPVGLNAGINAYAYVNANPVNFTNPQGLEAFRNDLMNALTQQISYFGGSNADDTDTGLSAGNQRLVQLAANTITGTASDANPGWGIKGSGTSPNGYTGLKGDTMQLAELLRGNSVKNTINQYSQQINQSAELNNVSPSLIKSMIFEEQTHLTPFESTLEQYGAGNTVGLGQMTVGKNGYSRDQLLQPAINIQAVAQHLNNLQTQLINKGIEPTPAALGTLYNCGSCTSITNYGRRIENFFIKYEYGL